MEHRQNAFTPEAATDEPASPANQPAADARDALDFEPVQLRYRDDGLTPAKQREYVEALADTGIGSAAAARVGVSERSVARLRRRADAASFNLACAAARRFGARNLHATAWERAIEGTIRGHYYHGALVSEERVYDNRLLTYLLGKTEHLLDEPPEAAAIAANWEPWMEAIEQGLSAPPEPEPEPEPSTAEDEEDGEVFTGGEVWEGEEDEWWTSFPPPAGFDGIEEGRPGGYGYKRSLSDAELAVIEADQAEERGEAIAREVARRDLYFGFEGGLGLRPAAEADDEDWDEDDDWYEDESEEEEGEEEEEEGEENVAEAVTEAPGEGEVSSPMEAGHSGRSGPSAGAEEPGVAPKAGAPAAGPAKAEFCEPS